MNARGIGSSLVVVAFGWGLVGCAQGGPFSNAAREAGAREEQQEQPAAEPPTPPPAQPARRSLRVSGWLPHWTQPEGDAVIDAQAGYGLDEVNPFGIGLQPDGSLIKEGGIERQRRIDAVHARGGEVIPTIFDVHDKQATKSVLASATRRATAIREILAVLDGRDYDGIDMDLEHAGTAERGALTAFLTELGREVQARGKVFSLTLPGKSQDLPSWGGYDYAALGKVADRVKLMCYGFSGSWSDPGPIAPVSWLRKVLAYAVSVIPREKIYLGLPLYGFAWSDDGSVKAKTLSAAEARDLLKLSPGGLHYVPSLGEAWFSYPDAEDGVGRTVFFSEERSIAAKAAVAREFGVAGISLWALGFGDDAIWQGLRSAIAPR